jgi:hypothetical protein
MSDESEIGTVLKNAPKIKEAFGAYLGTLITLVSLYSVRRRPGFAMSALLALLTAFQFWLCYWYWA